MKENLLKLSDKIEAIREFRFYGKVTSVKGLLVECEGLEKIVSIGSSCQIITRDNNVILSEVVGFNGNSVLLMPFTELVGVGLGCKVWLTDEQTKIFPTDAWKGRVINALAQPLDSKGELSIGNRGYRLKNSPPPANLRQRVEQKIDLGVRSINTFLTCCKGQRMGIFSGSGVGKSMLISMLTRYSSADVKVIGLIGERGREVQEFITEYLKDEGLTNAVVIVATADESALMRRQAAYLTLTIAEYFRDKGNDVLCLIDSITRFAMAQREIGLSAGEPPTTKGYTPTVFAELPKLLERAGPGMDDGSITAFFSVLVEGDDHNEPIADAARAILDGHIVLDREIAERGRFPAINILKSISRMMPACNSDEENRLISKAKQILSVYNDMRELIRLGAYKKGSDPNVDEAIKYYDSLESFLSQSPDETSSIDQGNKQLAEIIEEKK